MNHRPACAGRWFDAVQVEGICRALGRGSSNRSPLPMTPAVAEMERLECFVRTARREATFRPARTCRRRRSFRASVPWMISRPGDTKSPTCGEHFGRPKAMNVFPRSKVAITTTTRPSRPRSPAMAGTPQSRSQLPSDSDSRRFLRPVENRCWRMATNIVLDGAGVVG